MATANNPRKFSEKIALHNQKQAEETAAFEEVMKDLSITRAARVRSWLSGVFLPPHRSSLLRLFLASCQVRTSRAEEVNNNKRRFRPAAAC